LRIEDILAVIRGGDCVITGFEAELVAAEEVGPVLDLGDGGIVFGGWQVVGEDETAQWVSGQISSMRIKFAPCIVGLEADTGLVHETCDLNVSRRLDELNGCQGSGGHKTGTMAWLCAVGYNHGFNIPDDTIRLR